MGDITSACCKQIADQKAFTREELIVVDGVDGTQAFDQNIKQFINRFPKIKEVYNQKFRYCSNINKRNIVIRDKDIYVGKVDEVDTRRQAIIMYNNGFFYEGDLVNYMRDGLGDCYEGKWSKNQPEGQGTYESANPKRKYNGFWQTGQLQGRGKAIYQDGSHYEGEFYKNLRHGKGKIAYSDGTSYQGTFKNNIIQGFGTLIGINHKYEGSWRNGQINGAGKSYWYNQDNELLQTYQGQYLQGLKHGKGEYRWQNGRVFKGQWQNGEIKIHNSNIQKQK